MPGTLLKALQALSDLVPGRQGLFYPHFKDEEIKTQMRITKLVSSRANI